MQDPDGLANGLSTMGAQILQQHLPAGRVPRAQRSSASAIVSVGLSLQAARKTRPSSTGCSTGLKRLAPKRKSLARHNKIGWQCSVSSRVASSADASSQV